MYGLGDEIDGLREDIANLRRDNACLRKLVAKLPTSGDGYPIVPGMEVWRRGEKVRVNNIQDRVCCLVWVEYENGNMETVDPKFCFVRKPKEKS